MRKDFGGRTRCRPDAAIRAAVSNKKPCCHCPTTSCEEIRAKASAHILWSSLHRAKGSWRRANESAERPPRRERAVAATNTRTAAFGEPPRVESAVRWSSISPAVQKYKTQ